MKTQHIKQHAKWSYNTHITFFLGNGIDIPHHTIESVGLTYGQIDPDTVTRPCNETALSAVW